MSALPTRAVRALAVLALGAGLAVVGPAGPAEATNFGSTVCGGSPRNCVSLADNATHVWYPEGVLGNQVPGLAEAVSSAMSSYDRSSNLRTVQRRDTAHQDVLLTDFSYGDNGVYAWVECVPGSATSGRHPALRCDRQKVRFNDAYNDTLDAGRTLSLACHEIGHTVGLRHTTDPASCMNDELWVQRTSSHDHAHLNATY